jgi:uncharacterized protein YaaW (UPF0174 family)
MHKVNLMKHLVRLSLSLCLLAPFSTFAEDKTEQWQEWLFQLPNILEERTATGSNYMKNYLQCMDDQQALKNDSDMTIGELIDNALDSGDQCAPLLNEMLESLTDQPIESLSNKQKQELINKSL